MAIRLVREFQQKQQLSITPQLKKSIDLLQLSRLEIINRINNEIDENPFLNKVENLDNNSSFDDEDIIQNLSSMATLGDHLESQLIDLRLSPKEEKIALAIIQSLGEDGLLHDPLDVIEESLNFFYTYKEIQNVLEGIVHDLEPAGIGARNFKESIYLQLQRKNLDPVNLKIASEILFNPKYINFLDAKDALLLSFSEKLIEEVLTEIKKCDLSPGLEFEPSNIIQPDLEVMPRDNLSLDVKFKEAAFPNIVLDKKLIALTKDKKNNAGSQLIEKIDDAKWLIRAIKRRNETVYEVGSLICKIQADFLLDLSSELVPLSNIELAKTLKISPSTVSRILRSKYIQTPKGAVSMKSLLANSVSKTRKVTPSQLMEEIKQIIADESKKLSDQKIADLLNLRGFNLARRTITKYRKKINLPNSRNR